MAGIATFMHIFIQILEVLPQPALSAGFFTRFLESELSKKASCKTSFCLFCLLQVYQMSTKKPLNPLSSKGFRGFSLLFLHSCLPDVYQQNFFVVFLTFLCFSYFSLLFLLLFITVKQM